MHDLATGLSSSFQSWKNAQSQRGGTLSGGEQQMLAIAPGSDGPA